ncbi:MAG: hypothetical protein M0Q95_20995 [Porticoccaceae bacterium]|nr:hypothetical protein [Porticoccaceae bacterium]
MSTGENTRIFPRLRKIEGIALAQPITPDFPLEYPWTRLRRNQRNRENTPLLISHTYKKREKLPKFYIDDFVNMIYIDVLTKLSTKFSMAIPSVETAGTSLPRWQRQA